MPDKTIKIGTEITVEDAKKSAQELKSVLEDALSKAGKGKVKFSDGFVEQADKCIKKAEDLSKAIDDALSKDKSVPTAELDKLIASASEIEEKMTALKNSSKNGAWSTEEQQKEYKNLLTQLDAVDQKIKELHANGGAFTVSPETTAEVERLTVDLANANNETRRLIEQGVSIKSGLTAPTFNFGSAVKSAFGDVTRLYKKMFSLVSGTIKSGIRSLGNAISGLGGSAKSTDFDFKRLLTTLVKYGLGMRSLYTLFRKLRSAVSEGLQSLVEFNGGANSTATAIQSLKDSLAYLKGSWAAAFAPIIEFAIPYLTAIIDKIAQFANMLGAIFALFTGKQMMIKATKQIGGAADATKKGASAQKEWNNELYSFDELNRQSKQTDSSSGGGGGADFGMEMVDPKSLLPEWLSDWIERLKKAWNDEEFYKVGQILAEGLHHALVALDNWINNVFRPWGVKWAKNIAEIVNGFFESWYLWPQLGRTISDGIAAVLDIAATFLENTHFDSIGKALGMTLNAIFGNTDMWNQVSRFIAGYANAFIDFLDGFFEETLTKVGGWGNNLFHGLANGLKNIKWETLAKDVVNGVQFIINFLRGFLYDEKTWKEVSEAVSHAINVIIAQINLDDLGKELNRLLQRILEFLGSINWYELGYKVGQFLGEIDWPSIFTTVGKIIVDALWGAINGFLSTSQGKVTAIGLTIGGLLAGAVSVGMSLVKAALFKSLMTGTSFTTVLSGMISGISTAISTAVGAISALAAPIAAVIAVVVALSAAYGGLGGVLEKVGSVIGGVVERVKEFAKFVGLSEAIDKLKTSFGHLIDMLARLKPLWDALFVVIGTVVEGALNMIVGGITGIATAISGVIDVIVSVLNLIMDAFTDTHGNVIETLTMLKDGVLNIIGGMAMTIVGVIAGFVQSIIDLFLGLKQVLIGDPIVVDIWQGILDIFTSFGELVIGAVTTFITTVVQWFTDMMTNLTTLFTTVWDLISGIFNNVFTVISEAATAFVTFLVTGFTEFMTNANALFTTGWTAIQTITTTIWNAIQNFLTTLFNAVRATLSSIATGILGDITSMWNNLQSTTMSILNALKSSVIGLWNGLKSALKAISFRDVGEGIVNGIKSGINALWESLKNSFLSKVRDLVDSAKRLLQINSPSKVFAEIGENIALGMAEGISNENSPEKATEEMIDSITGMDATVDELPNSLDAVLSRLAMIADQFTSINETFQAMANMPIPAMATAGAIPSNIPVSSMYSDAANTDIASAISSALGNIQMNGGQQPQEIKIYIRGKEVFDAVVAENNSAIMRTGKSPLVK